MEGTHDALASSTTTLDSPRSRRRGWQLAIGPALATGLLLLASVVLAPRLSLAFWALLPVAVVALIVTGLLGSLLDAPSGRFSRRLSVYSLIVAWMWRALVIYGVGLALFVGTIWFFD